MFSNYRQIDDHTLLFQMQQQSQVDEQLIVHHNKEKVRVLFRIKDRSIRGALALLTEAGLPERITPLHFWKSSKLVEGIISEQHLAPLLFSIS